MLNILYVVLFIKYVQDCAIFVNCRIYDEEACRLGNWSYFADTT